MRKIIFQLIVIVLTTNIFCQNWKTFTIEDGLIDNAILSMAIDSSGKKWFGTENGVSVYDNEMWQKYDVDDGLIFNQIHSITVGKDNDIWFGTQRGASKFDGVNWTDIDTKAGLLHFVVNDILIQDSAIWFATFGGVSNLKDTIWTHYTYEDGLSNPWATSITLDKNTGNIWAGTYTGYDLFDGETWSAKYGAGWWIEDIYMAADSTPWIMVVGKGVFNQKTLENFNGSNSVIGNNVRAMATDENGNLWFGSDNGVSMYNGTSFVNYTTDDGLCNNSVRAMFFDKDFDLWIGTSNGVSVLRRNGEFPVTHIEEIRSSIFIYPNPVVEELNILNADNTSVEIYDIKGNLLFSGQNISKIDMHNFNNGVYVVRILSKNEMITKRIIKFDK